MNSNSSKFSIRKRLASFKHAIDGIRALFKFEHNSRIHLVAAIVAVALGFALKISSMEWAIIVVAIAIVCVAEIFNSAIEMLADHISPDYNDTIKTVKDYCAAAVLLSALASLIIGLVIFLPKIW